tara:strand:- start:174 stop:329 length:156 start_codon:yes stop_codon:yes gene_type:complete
MSYTETILEYVYEQYCLFDDLEEALDALEDQMDFSREEIKEMIEYCIERDS